MRILDPQPGEAVYDPACGSGGMLVETINEIREAGGDSRTLRLYGQEINLTTAAIARMNLFLHDLEDFRIVRGDTLRDPRFLDRSGLRKFDVVVANPPFSLKNWGADTWAGDPYDRAFCGVPPASSADLACAVRRDNRKAPDNPDPVTQCSSARRGWFFSVAVVGRVQPALRASGSRASQ